MTYFTTPDWDGGIAAHPDELHLLNVATQVAPWGDVCTAVPEFAYGHLPVNGLSLLIRVAPEADPLYAARLTAGLWGLLLVVVGGAWGRRLAGERGERWAALLVAAAPFTIQQAHFFTVDLPAAVFSAVAVLAAVRRRWGMAGALAGLALACKASLFWVSGALFFAVMDGGWRFFPDRARCIALIRTGVGAGLAFLIASPWAVLRPVTCGTGPWVQAMMVAGRLDFPYTRQYAGTQPYLYPLVQMALWGLGPATVLAGLGGLGGGLVRWRSLSRGARIGLVWTLLFFGMTAGLYVKFPRYLVPIYPFWAAWAARALRGERSRGWRWACWALTALLGWAQLSIYQQPHPWVEVSRWLYTNVEAGRIVVVEAWDYPLPVLLSEGAPENYRQETLPVFDSETPEKAARLAELTRAADVVVLASPRGYGALVRQPATYASTLDWYHRLLAAPEFKVRAWNRCPHLGPIALSDDPLADAGMPVPLSLAARCGTPYAIRLPRLDESFRVYDAPAVLLLVR